MINHADGTGDSGWAAGITTFAILSLGVALGYVNFVRWDNMETFLPAIWYAHGELLHGRLPLWNPLQNLGEPLHALGISGMLYLPYTLTVAVTKLLHWPAATALDLIAIAHATFGAIGLVRLLSDLRVRRSLAFAAAVSAMLSGFALVMGAIWVHVLPNLAWSVWAMWGLRRIIAGEGGRSAVVMATVALGAVFHTGHAQSGANVWLAVWSWAFLMAIGTGALRQRLTALLLVGCGAVLLALPALIPTAMILPEADRWSRNTTPGANFSVQALLGLLTPVLRKSDGARVHSVLVLPFIGAWIVPGLLLGLGAARKRRALADQQLRVFLITSAVGLAFVWLSLGHDAGLSALLHKAPLWQRFRDPYKYFERAVPLLVVAAALGLELAVRTRPSRLYSLMVLLLAVASAVLWVLYPAREPLILLAGITVIASLLAIAVLPHASSALALAVLAVVQAIAVVGITHTPGRSKSYAYDRNDAARLPLTDTLHRVLPLSEGPTDHPYTRPLAIFYAPMLDGYASASGHRFALSAARLNGTLHTSVAGVPTRRRESLPVLLASNFVKLADVGHLVVDHADTAAVHTVRRVFPYAAVTTTPQARIFHIGGGTPRVYFATDQVPGDYDGIYEALYGTAPLFSAALPGDKRRRVLPRASVLSWNWGRDRASARIDAPNGGLLVFSTSYSPEWQANADGRKLTVIPVSDIFAGVWVPPGAENVTIRIRRWPLFVWLIGAGLGVALMLFGSRLISVRTQERL